MKTRLFALSFDSFSPHLEKITRLIKALPVPSRVGVSASEGELGRIQRGLKRLKNPPEYVEFVDKLVWVVERSGHKAVPLYSDARARELAKANKAIARLYKRFLDEEVSPLEPEALPASDRLKLEKVDALYSLATTKVSKEIQEKLFGQEPDLAVLPVLHGRNLSAAGHDVQWFEGGLIDILSDGLEANRPTPRAIHADARKRLELLEEMREAFRKRQLEKGEKQAD